MYRIFRMMASRLLWPLLLPFRLIAWATQLIGRLMTIGAGLMLMVAGVVVSFTIIGAVVGVSMILVGFLLARRGFF